jgi:hypothetical protein
MTPYILTITLVVALALAGSEGPAWINLVGLALFGGFAWGMRRMGRER